jgi:WD40 repeat protein
MNKINIRAYLSFLLLIGGTTSLPMHNLPSLKELCLQAVVKNITDPVSDIEGVLNSYGPDGINVDNAETLRKFLIQKHSLLLSDILTSLSESDFHHLNSGQVPRLQLSPNGRYCVAMLGRKKMSLLNIVTDKSSLWEKVKSFFSKDKQFILPQGAERSKYLVFSPDSTKMITTADNNIAYLWDVATATLVAPLQGHAGPILSVAFSPTGNYVLTGSSDGTARLWDTAAGNIIAVLQGHTDSVVSVALSTDGKYALTGSIDSSARLWDIQNIDNIQWRILGDYAHATRRAVGFSFDNKYAFSISLGGIPCLYDIEDMHNIQCYTLNHHSPVMSAQFSPNSKHILTISYDTIAHLWDIQDIRNARSITLSGDTQSAAFSPDGTRALTEDQTAVRLWDVATGNSLAVLKNHRHTVAQVLFGPDSNDAFLTVFKYYPIVRSCNLEPIQSLELPQLLLILKLQQDPTIVTQDSYKQIFNRLPYKFKKALINYFKLDPSLNQTFYYSMI